MELKTVRANQIEFAYFTQGEGPLVLCLHGFPDTAYSYRALLPVLAQAGYRAVAPFLRGYFPTSLAPDADYSVTALARDVLALIDVLTAERAIVIGHDWGGYAAYLAAQLAPARIEKLVVGCIPHLHAAPFRLAQLRRSWYVLFFQLPQIAEMFVRRHDFALIDKLYAGWSPHWHVPTDELEAVKASLRRPGGLAAALGYYRAFARQSRKQFEQLAQVTTTPTLFFAGAHDGAVGIELFENIESCFLDLYAFRVFENAGHFPHREMPERFAAEVLAFLRAAPGTKARSD